MSPLGASILAGHQLAAAFTDQYLHRIDARAEFQEEENRGKYDDTGKASPARCAKAGTTWKSKATTAANTAGKTTALAALIFNIVTLPAALPTHFLSPGSCIGTDVDAL